MTSGPVEITDAHRQWAAKALPEFNVELESSKLMLESVARQIANAEARGQDRARGGVRVIRVLEYVYPDAQAAADDQARWVVQAARRHGRTFIRSTVLPMEVLGG
jgi:hypothetical protein